MYMLLRADQRVKQNHKDENLPAHPQKYTHWGNNLDRYWTRRLFAHRLLSVKTTECSSSSRSSTSRRRWSDWIHNGIRRRKQEKISVLFWLFRNNSLSPSSSRTFRIQSYWSYSTGQCDNSEQLLPVHLSRRMCNQFAFHHQFGIETWRSKFWQNTDRDLSACGSYGQRPQGSCYDRLEWTAPSTTTCRKHGRDIRTRYIGSTSILLCRKDWCSIRLDRTPSSFTKHSQLIVFRKLLGWKLEKSYTKKVYMSPRPPPKISLKHDWKKRIGFRSCSTSRKDKLFNNLKVPNQTNQTQIMIERRHPLFAVTQVTRKVTSNQCWTRLTFTSEHFGLPHSVVKQAENHRVRELVKKIEM